MYRVRRALHAGALGSDRLFYVVPVEAEAAVEA
jgi:hypothetical protein